MALPSFPRAALLGTAHDFITFLFYHRYAKLSIVQPIFSAKGAPRGCHPFGASILAPRAHRAKKAPPRLQISRGGAPSYILLIYNHSLRRAMTGSFFAAALAGMSPEIRVRMTEMTTMTAAPTTGRAASPEIPVSGVRIRLATICKI